MKAMNIICNLFVAFILIVIRKVISSSLPLGGFGWVLVLFSV